MPDILIQEAFLLCPMVEIANFTLQRSEQSRSAPCLAVSYPLPGKGRADISVKAWEWTVYSVARLWRAPTMID